MGTFTMPSLGADMAAGTLVEWLKQPGDRVEHGDIIAVVETDKGAIEVEVFESGELEALLVEPGQSVPVGTALARINGGGGSPADPVTPTPEPAPIAAAPPAQSLRQPKREAGLPPATHPGLRVSPAARKLSVERGIDLASLEGTGPGDAIQLRDVERACPPSETAPTAGIDHAAMRRAIAAAMARSKREIPHYYLAHRIDLSPALAWLAQYNEARPPTERLLIGAVLLKATALALRDLPEFNGHFEDGEFAPAAAIHVGSAISIRGGGLAAPAIRDTDTHSLADLMEKLRDLVARTRRGQMRSSEIADPTVTVSSLGERGVESLWPVIYPPQVAIIGFGSPRDQAWVVDEKVAIRSVMTVALAGDHRANDGHRGALLLRKIEELLMQPEAL